MTDDTKRLVLEFTSNRALYEAFTKSLCGALTTIFENHQLEVLPLEMRTKEIDSLNRKINKESKRDKYKVLTDVTDLSGVRVIAFLQQDCSIICNVIEENFEIDWANSVKKDEELDADKFGYLSTHYVLSYGPARLKVEEFRRFEGLKAEVQVRTILQHAWAAIDWKLRYKSRNEVPKELRRRLFRISALLEAADDDFSHVSRRIDELRLQYGYQIEHGNLDIPINAESYEEYITRSAEVKSLNDLAIMLGLGTEFEDARIYSPAPLFATLDQLDIRTLEQFDKIIRNFLQKAKPRFEQLIKARDDDIAFSLAGILRFAVLDNVPKTDRRRILRQRPFISNWLNTFLTRPEPKKTKPAPATNPAASRRPRTKR